MARPVRPFGFPVLRQLLLDRQHEAFLDELLLAQEDADQTHGDYLCALGGDGLALLLKEETPPDELLSAYARLVVEGRIHANPELILALNEHQPSPKLLTLALTAAIADIRSSSPARQAKPESDCSDAGRAPIIHVRRVVQITELGLGSYSASDALGIRRSVFRSEQERTFLRALALRFPGLQAFPNYPLDQLADFRKLENLLDDETLEYGRHCRVDAVLVIPDQGDPIAAFELDSPLHDDPVKARRDRLRNRLFRVIQIPLFRLRAEQSYSVGIDEWYALLTDEVAHKIDCGHRLRIRSTHARLVPV